MAEPGLRVSRSCVLSLDDVEWRFSGSGGPGGQHANTANTKAEVRLNVLAARSLGPRQKARIIERLGPVVRVVASDERSQARNRQLALERLAAKLAGALRTETVRRPTRPTLGSRERRLQSKRLNSARKQDRRRPDFD